MSDIIYLSLLVSGVGLFLYTLTKVILLAAKHYFNKEFTESIFLKEAQTILLTMAAVCTAIVGMQAYDKLRQSLTVDMQVTQVESPISDDKKGLIIKLKVTNNGLDKAIIRTAENDNLLTVSQINYSNSAPTRLYSEKEYHPYYFYKIATIKNNEFTQASETVYERTITRGETKDIVFYVEVDIDHVYHISSKLTGENLFFSENKSEVIGNGSERDSSNYKFFESDYIHVGGN